MDPRRPARPSAALGAVVWIALLALTDPGPAMRWVLLAPLVIVPLVLPLVATPTRTGEHHSTHRLAATLQLPAALLVAAATLLPPGPVAAALALPWLGVAALVASFGLWRLLPRGTRPVEELVIDAGLLYLPVGATALLLDRLGESLVFSPRIVRLTAAHFHYATFLLPVAFGLLGRRLARQRRAYAALSVGAIASVPPLALGITFSPALELAGATTFAGAVAVLGLLAVVAAPRLREADPLAALSVAVAGLTLVATMALAVGYAIRQFWGVGPLTIPVLLRTHAPLNVAGFALPILLALYRLRLPTRADPPGVPLSPLTAGRRVGPDYPERNGLRGAPVAGQVEDLAVYDGEGFDADEVNPAVRRFYERTAEYDLQYRARWHDPLAPATTAAMRVTRRLEQLALPTDGAVHGMDGRLRRIPWGDDRDGARFWVRTDAGTGHGVFVAAYGTHAHDGTTYMNVGMPLPGSNLSAVLRPVSPEDGSLVLSSSGPGDAGLYLSTPLAPVQLPMHERFQVWPASHDDAPEVDDDLRAGLDDVDLVATHRMWLHGWPFLSIRYAIGRE